MQRCETERRGDALCGICEVAFQPDKPYKPALFHTCIVKDLFGSKYGLSFCEVCILCADVLGLYMQFWYSCTFPPSCSDSLGDGELSLLGSNIEQGCRWHMRIAHDLYVA